MIQLFSLFHLLRETVQLYVLCTRNQGTVALDLAMNANFIRVTTPHERTIPASVEEFASWSDSQQLPEVLLQTKAFTQDDG